MNKVRGDCQQENYFASSDPHHGIQFIPSDILSGKSSGILFGFEILSGILSGISSGILSVISSDILSGISMWHSIWHVFRHRVPLSRSIRHAQVKDGPSGQKK